MKDRHVKIIWVCWFQGEESDMPPLNRECIRRWRSLNPDWQINVLSDASIDNFVPEFNRIVKDTPFERGLALKSDLLRILLLEKYGGVWVDASVYPMLPLSDFYDKVVNDTGFFTYRFMPIRKQRLTVSWFLCASQKDHYLIKKWRKKFVKRFTSEKEVAYYMFHNTLRSLYNSDKKIKHIINNMVQLKQRPCMNNRVPENSAKKDSPYMYKRPKYWK